MESQPVLWACCFPSLLFPSRQFGAKTTIVYIKCKWYWLRNTIIFPACPRDHTLANQWIDFYWIVNLNCYCTLESQKWRSRMHDLLTDQSLYCHIINQLHLNVSKHKTVTQILLLNVSLFLPHVFLTPSLKPCSCITPWDSIYTVIPPYEHQNPWCTYYCSNFHFNTLNLWKGNLFNSMHVCQAIDCTHEYHYTQMPRYVYPAAIYVFDNSLSFVQLNCIRMNS